LTTYNKVIGFEVVSIGSLTESVIHPREVFKSAIVHNARSIVLVHNHPSGDSAPSEEDRKITEVLKQAGALLGINVLDHLIVGDDGYFSFADTEWM
jgi:DNA repair protein RadC